MSTRAEHTNDFVGYPTNRVVGAFADAANARAAVDDLLAKGVGSNSIDVLGGESGLHRLDPDGTEHGVLARLQRAVISIAAINEESRDLKHYVDDVRAGHVLVMVKIDRPGMRSLVAERFRHYGAQHLGFFGRWAWEALDDTTVLAHALDRPEEQRFEIILDGHTTELEFVSESEMNVVDPAAATREAVRVRATEIRPHVYMVSWQQPDRAAVVHVQDRTNGIVYASTTGADGSLSHMQGSLRPLH